MLEKIVTRKPSTRPSWRTAALNFTFWSRAWLAACMCSDRVSIHFTGALSRRAIQASKISSG